MTPLLNAISLRISLIFSLFTIVILLIMGIVIHQLVMHHFEQQDHTQLEGKVELIENLLKQYPNNDLFLTTQLKDALVGHHGLMVQIERPIGHLLLSSHPPLISSKLRLQDAKNPLTEWQTNGHNFRGLIVTSPHTKLADSHQIILGIDTTEHQLFLDDFRQQLLIIGSAGTLTLMLLGWVAARRGLRPAHTMARVAEGISAQDLTGRLEVNHIPVELRSLAIAFNEMLDRLESAVARLSDFSSDLTHELRTPINNLMTQTQVCLSRKRDISTYQEVLFSNLEEYERLARMISDMLFLAKAEHGLCLPNLQPVKLDQEVQALFEFYDALAAEKGMKLASSGKATIQGDALMLRRALSNLLSNALRYAKPGTDIHVVIVQQASSTIITIQNEGPTISKDQQQRIFDRFYRTDASRRRTDEGAGLGLAITKSIVEAHGGCIEVDSEREKTTFKIKLFKQAS